MVDTALPAEVEATLAHFVTTEYTALDASGHPATWPLIPYYLPTEQRIEVGVGLGTPKKANDARRNPRVALLLSDPTGSGLTNPPYVLVQGTATVHDRYPAANFERSLRAFTEKLPRRRVVLPPRRVRRFLPWYFARICIFVLIERLYVWPGADTTHQPQRIDLDPPVAAPSATTSAGADRRGREAVWDTRLDGLGRTYDTAVVSVGDDDGYPFAIRVPIGVDPEAGRIRIENDPPGVPLRAGPACMTVHDHDADFSWFRTCQVRGELVREDGDGPAFLPHRVIGGDYLLPGRRPVSGTAGTVRRTLAYRRRAKRAFRELSPVR